MNTVIITLLAILGVALLIAFFFIGIYNKLVHLKTLVQEAWSNVDVYLKQRYDLIPNLVNTVKGYATHEQSVFENVTKARAASMGATSVADKAQAEAGLAGALKTLFAVSENYPELKANQNFLALQQELAKLEQQLQLARRYYNGTTRNYNAATQTFPSSIVAGSFGFAPEQFFELDSASERSTPEVKF